MKLDDCINLDDLRIMAQKRLPKVIYDYIEGGVDDEVGLQCNEGAFRARHLLPRYMVDIAHLDQSTTLFGKTYSTAVGIAPTGGLGNFRHDADLMLARAARDANIPFIMSGVSTASMEDMAREAPDHGWYQMYTARDRSISEDMIRRADKAGIPALVVSVDVPVTPNRERNRRNGYSRTPKFSLATKLNALSKPAWFKDYIRYGFAMLENWKPYAPSGASPEEVGDFVSAQIPVGLTWSDIERFRELWPRTFILKGVMRTDDAIRAANIGVDGLIVSNHGGRQLDLAPAAIDVLPALDAAVGSRMTLMVDGGIRRGSDVAIALASGAKFVFLGRPTLYGTVAGGQAGAAKALGIIRDELNKIMAQIGCPTLSQLGPEFLYIDNETPGRNARGGK